MRKRTQSRELALQVLYQINITQDSPDDVLKAFWAESDAKEDVREFTNGLVRGTLEHLVEIDPVIVKYAENWKINRMAVIDRNILRLAIYELLFTQEIPPKVSINEAVNLAKKYSQADSGKFVNGVLDKVCHSEKMPEGKTS